MAATAVAVAAVGCLEVAVVRWGVQLDVQEGTLEVAARAVAAAVGKWVAPAEATMGAAARVVERRVAGAVERTAG